jgi:hypothetical protein
VAAADAAAAGGPAELPCHQRADDQGVSRQLAEIKSNIALPGVGRTAIEDGCPPLVADVEPAEDDPAEAVTPPGELTAAYVVPPAGPRRRARLGTSPDALDGPSSLVLGPEGVAGGPLGLGLREEGRRAGRAWAGREVDLWPWSRRAGEEGRRGHRTGEPRDAGARVRWSSRRW